MVIDKGIFAFLFGFYQFVRKHQSDKLILIKSPSPNNPTRFSWGDFHLANDLCQGICAMEGYCAYLIPFEYWDVNWINKKATASIVVTGVRKTLPHSSNPHYMYLISHPDDIEDDYYHKFVSIFSASDRYAKALQNKGIDCIYCSQFTNTSRFYPNVDGASEVAGKVLFVGNTRGVYRQSVQYCVDNDIDVCVYGKGWEEFIPSRYIKGESVPNDSLLSYYYNAAIVLNDHWDDMREQGFVSNRIFDVTACEGFIISDHIDVITTDYQGCVPTFSSEKELVDLIHYYMEHEQERKTLAKTARQITHDHHTHTTIAAKMLDAMKLA